MLAEDCCRGSMRPFAGEDDPAPSADDLAEHGHDAAALGAQRTPSVYGSERDLRPQVVKWKISGGTRSDRGRACRDALLGLLQTCAKLGVSFWDYLGHRLAVPDTQAPYLPDLKHVLRELESDLLGWHFWQTGRTPAAQYSVRRGRVPLNEGQSVA